MDTQKAHFIKNEFVQRIRQAPAAESKWGKMNVQQMTEHVTDFFNVSAGIIYYPLVTPEEYLPKFKAFLLSDKEFRENTKAPAEILGDEPEPVKNESPDIALTMLEKSIRQFFEFFETNPSAITTHPVFGPLNFDEWVLLHYKHVRHHAKQFGLLGE